MELITFVLFAAVTGYTFTALLLSPGELLDFLPALVHRLTKSDRVLQVLQCEKCFAGQLAFWLYPLIFWTEYDWQHHFMVVIFSIFTAHVIGKIIPESPES